MRKLNILYLLPFFFGEFSIAENVKEIDPTKLRFREMVATRVETPPIVDGIIDDKVWKTTVPESGFLQYNPYVLGHPSEKTEVRIIYDNDYLFIAINNFDSEPDKIIGRLARRDSWMEAFGSQSDWVGVAFDSNNDDRTGYWLAVNPAGSRMDVYVSGEGFEAFDPSWDVVWEYKAARHNLGWSVEMKIPFSIFQFDANKNEDWGIAFERHIQRLQEEVQWPCRPKGVSGFIPYFGILKGLSDIPSPKKVEILPYVLYGINDESNLETLGLDMRYGLSASSSLNLTINPDFGQVEADPSVLNLTAFETQFEEKRPFFVEGGSFFKNLYQLLHSRRIGQAPGVLVPEENVILNRSENTTILGAGKILGEMSGGTKYGLIEAITDEEFGTWETESGDTVSGLIEPRSNYFIGRVEQPVINSLSTVGLMITDVRRNEAGYANIQGLDWKLKFMENALTLKGQFVHSLKDKISGSGGRFNIGYNDPTWWDLNFATGFKDDKYDINDLGFNQRNDIWYYGIWGGLRKQEPWGKYFNNKLEFKYHKDARGDGLSLSKFLKVEQKNELKSYWSFGSELNMQFAAYNNEDTFRDERAWIYRSETEGYGVFWFQTDRRKSVIIRPFMGFGGGEYRSWGYRAGLNIKWRPLDNMNLMIEGFQDLGPKSMEWVGIDEDSTGINIVYAESAALMNDIQFRFNWTFTSELSFEAFVQPFTVDMNYKNFYKLMAEKTRDLEPYNYLGDPDFKVNNIVGTFVLRWEYYPGSTLYLVYNLNNNKFYSAEDDSWYIDNSNSFFIKFNYWLQI